MCVTSIGEVVFPSAFKLIVMALDNLLNLFDLCTRKSKVSRQFDLRFQPKLCLTVATVDVNVCSRFLAGEKEKPIALFSKDSRTHGFES